MGMLGSPGRLRKDLQGCRADKSALTMKGESKNQYGSQASKINNIVSDKWEKKMKKMARS
jgi:hypothetical protein